mgnify:CR=1 FL=1
MMNQIELLAKLKKLTLESQQDQLLTREFIDESLGAERAGLFFQDLVEIIGEFVTTAIDAPILVALQTIEDPEQASPPVLLGIAFNSKPKHDVPHKSLFVSALPRDTTLVAQSKEAATFVADMPKMQPIPRNVIHPNLTAKIYLNWCNKLTLGLGIDHFFTSPGAN